MLACSSMSSPLDSADFQKQTFLLYLFSLTDENTKYYNKSTSLQFMCCFDKNDVHVILENCKGGVE